MQRPSQFPPSLFSASGIHSNSEMEPTHLDLRQQTIRFFVEEISRTLNLSAEQRDMLHVAANFSATLPKETLLQNIVCVLATTFKLEAKIANLEQKLDAIQQHFQGSKISGITDDQRARMQAIVKAYLVQPDRIQWDIAQEVMDFLDADQVRLELEAVFGNVKLKKDLLKDTRKFSTDQRNYLRIIIRNSLGLTEGKPELKSCISKTVDDIARRFLDITAARVPPEFFIFVALLRYIARENPLLINRSSEQARPQKGKDWWAGVSGWFQEKMQLWGNDRNMGEWFDFIQAIIADERKFHPEDPIACLPSPPSIPVNQSVLPSTPASNEYTAENTPTTLECLDYVSDINYENRSSPFQRQDAVQGQSTGSSSFQNGYQNLHSGSSHAYQNSYYC
ncbi:hypothetical protein M422DRAFT_276188 [Sphaerobolus stellatus SS14]|uniref:Uncharacterized protein n=1 Tax=Sphaerobolus stellatus (strain SS14) TaxID=990650 RepID=A0A0C9U2G9_SPHS4|nr:hypothetical protein M422DRAFT_276188 [Sphaerobolus stellatus SS14]